MRSRIQAHIASVILSVIILLGCAGNSFAYTLVENDFASSRDEQVSITSAQIFKDTFFLIANGKLYSRTNAQSQSAIILDFSIYSEVDWTSLLLTTDGISLYVLNSSSGALYVVQDTALVQSKLLDVSDLGVLSEDGQRYITFSHPVVSNGYLYVIYTEPENYEQQLYRFSLDSGEKKHIDTNGALISEIAPYKANQLLAFDQNTLSLMVFDAGTGKKIDSIGLLTDYDSGAFVYDEMQDRIYYITGTSLMFWQSQKNLSIDNVPFNGGFSTTYAGLWSGKYTVLDSAGLFTFDTTAGESQQDVITLWYEPNSFPDTTLIAKYNLQYPEHPIVTRSTEGKEPAELLTTANMSKDGSIDIFVMQSYNLELDSIIRHGFAAPIASEALKTDVQSMYPQIQDYLTRDDNLYAYPVYLYPDFCTANLSLLQESNFSAVPQTMQTYLEQLLQCYKDNDETSLVYSFDGSATVQEQWRRTLDILIAQYVKLYGTQDEPLSFNTPIFREALESLAALSPWKNNVNARNSMDTVSRSLYDMNAQSPFAQENDPNASEKQYFLTPTFTEDEQPVLDASLMFFVINPSSAHKELAEKFLEFYSENMELVLKYMLHPNNNDLVEKVGYADTEAEHKETISNYKQQIATLEAEDSQAIAAGRSSNHDADLRTLRESLAQEESSFIKLQNERWIVSEHEINTYRSLASSLSFANRALSWTITENANAANLLMRYLEGTTSLDQTLKALDQKVAMLFLEGQ